MRTFFLTLLCVIISAIVALPSLCSTRWGAQTLSHYLSSDHREVSVGMLDLNWFGTQKIYTFHYKDSAFDARIPQMTIHSSLWQLLFSRNTVGNATIEDPWVQYVYPLRESHRPLIPITKYFVIKNGTLVLVSENTQDRNPLELVHIYATLQPTSLALQGKSSQGEIDIQSTYQGESFTIEACTKNFPSRFLDIIPQGWPFSSAFLGDTISLNMEGEFHRGTGSITLKIDAPYSSFHIAGRVSDGAFSLTHPLKGKITVSPALSQLIQEKTEFQPLSSSKHSVQIRIDPNDTYIPIDPFSLKNCQLPNIELSLGKLSFINAENTANILSLIQLKARRNARIPVWFQNTKLRIHEGLLDIHRTDFLFDDHYHLATWGKIDLRNSHIDMLLGITGQALKKILHLKKDLPPSFILTLPVEGRPGNLKVHKSVAAKKLALLIAGEKIPLRGSIPPSLLSDAEQAPPSQHPFPWEVRFTH